MDNTLTKIMLFSKSNDESMYLVFDIDDLDLIEDFKQFYDIKINKLNDPLLFGATITKVEQNG